MKALIALAGITLCVLMGCHNDQETHGEEHAVYTATMPFRTDTSFNREYVCQIRAMQHIELRALERGYLQDVLVDEGQSVPQGKLMFQIMPVIYEAEYRKSQAEASLADIEYRNTKALADSHVVSKNELAMSKAKLEHAEAEMALAHAHLQFTRITAPFTGIMDRLHVRKGSLLEEGDILATLSDNSEMWVYFNVPEAQYLSYNTANLKEHPISVQLRLANNQVYTYPGAVTTIEADFNNETGNIAFRATFPNKERLLRHGETGTVLMTETLKGALLIPQKATFEILDKKFVYVIDKSNRIHARQIGVAAELPHVFAIKDGLLEGDRVLLDGLRKVRENDKVKVKLIDPASAIRSLELYAE